MSGRRRLQQSLPTSALPIINDDIADHELYGENQAIVGKRHDATSNHFAVLVDTLG